MQLLLTELARIVGPTHVLTEGDLSAWEQDWRKRSRGKALAVVRPGSTDEVALCLILFVACALHVRLRLKNAPPAAA